VLAVLVTQAGAVQDRVLTIDRELSTTIWRRRRAI
jgi:hypothetical protein